jgi:hypothetical protein
MQAAPFALSGVLLRMVESQEQIATTKLVDTLDEQAALEEMLEVSKPPGPGARRHYLLSTPFRYPPLQHGSRFGARFEPSLFYGSLSRASLLAEAAFYRFFFWHGMAAPPKDAFVTQHTAFSARYRTGKGLRLQAPPFDAHRAALTDPASYAETQALGQALRGAGVEAFEFVSARDPQGGLNVALFTPKALASSKPLGQERWVCRTDGEQVQFLCETDSAVYTYPLDTFLVAGKLPQAAA